MTLRRFLRRAWLPALALGAVLAAQAAGANRLKLWEIVHSQCVAAALKSEPLAPPCVEVDLKGGEARGEVILKDRVGVAQLLALPAARVTGIEDPQLLAPDAPLYFAGAWRARADMRRYLAAAPARAGLSIAVNSMVSRSQDQLHLHVDCLTPDVAKVLADYAPYVDGQWRAMTVALNGRKYWARRVDSADLEGIDPFHILADEMANARGEMGLWSLAAAPMSFGDKPGFVLLADHAELTAGGHAEDLQDHDCALARP
ncbi:MAG: CDP-diacylglycerol diphosphatase [Pseudomonadota bacterium]|nr:CDP-diacylglycerol diphosphatase [Pseudomonadota bacterium]